MIIDCILDRKDAAEQGDRFYIPARFYRKIFQYGKIGDEITLAMDYGTESDVKRALCDYVIRNEYNPAICGFIWSVNWLSAEI